MSVDVQHIDSVIFDMDGTLWNATESYAAVWNAACAKFGKETNFTGSDLTQFMGMSIDDILDNLLGDNAPASHNQFMEALMQLEEVMMPSLGGILYPGVKDGLEVLAKHYRLFMLSNCSSRGLINFTSFTGTSHLFEGLLSQGERPATKCENLKYLTIRHELSNPIYVGDTQADCNEAHKAGIPFAYATYGFRQCHDADWEFDSFPQLVEFLLDIKK